MAYKTLQVRKDTAANWTSNNPKLFSGELGFETDTNYLKVGDGATDWTGLGYRLQQGVLSTSSPQFAKVKTPIIYPASDSTTAVQINKADGTTNVLNIDTTNSSVGIGTTSPKAKLDVGVGGGDIFLGYDYVGVNQLYKTFETAHDAGNVPSQLNVGMADGAFTGIRIFDVRDGSYNSQHIEFVTHHGGISAGSRMTIDKDGKVGIGTASPNQLLTVENSISLKEIAAANADTAAYGQIWVQNTTPNELWFTDDAGTDTQISSHPLDAPTNLYAHGPGIDWIGKRVQKYLGKIYWQAVDGTVIVETFDEYNTRRKDEPGHIDLVKRDWGAVHREKAVLEYQRGEVEIPLEEAIEEIEITEEVEGGFETKTEFEFNSDTGEVKEVEKQIPVFATQGTGKFRKQIKEAIRFDTGNGKFYRARTKAEAQAMITPKDIPEMPKWIKDELGKKIDIKGDSRDSISTRPTLYVRTGRSAYRSSQSHTKRTRNRTATPTNCCSKRYGDVSCELGYRGRETGKGVGT